MKKEVPMPDVKNVNDYLIKWNKDKELKEGEDCLSNLFSTHPNNTKIEDILLKCACLNQLYSTNIFAIYQMAKHIEALKIDSRLKSGDESLIDDIANITLKGKNKRFYCFATKYCCLHEKDKFPIYDKFVEKVLVCYNKNYKFSTFKKRDLKDYNTFKQVVIDFRKHFSLTSFNFREIDKFLWQVGKELFKKSW